MKLLWSIINSSLLSLFLVSTSSAETIEVQSESFLETKTLELPAGRKADVIVMLASAGEMVSNFNVLLLDAGDKSQIGEAASDANGEVLFPQVPPGKYIVRISLTRDKRKRSTIQVGDIVLRAAK